MTSNDLRPASEIARQFGVKALVFGPPGQGKTPTMQTAPRPVACLVEPGVGTLKNSNMPVYVAPSYDRVNEFVTWATQSNEARNFDTFFVDSASQIAQNIEELERPKHKDSRKMFYEVQIKVWALFNRLYLAPNMHVVAIAKELVTDQGNIMPMFPSRKITRDMLHLFALNARFAKKQFGNEIYQCFQCLQGYDLHMEVRSQFSALAQYEPPDYTALFRKAMEL